jgi:Pyruvate/2-oxoacid:ferredoxin oxidoreductase delta subunit
MEAIIKENKPCDCPKDKDGECIPMTELEKLKIGHKAMSNSYKLQIEKLKDLYEQQMSIIKSLRHGEEWSKCDRCPMWCPSLELVSGVDGEDEWICDYCLGGD